MERFVQKKEERKKKINKNDAPSASQCKKKQNKKEVKHFMNTTYLDS